MSQSLINTGMIYISINDILLPSLYIKLRLMKNFVKILDKEEHDFTYLQKYFQILLKLS